MDKYVRYCVILLLCIVGYLIVSDLPHWIVNEMIFALCIIAMWVLGWSKES